MMSHDEANELLAALALNALESDEALEVEAHVATCPRCQSELDGFRAVAASLGNSVEPLPEGLWTNISSQLWESKGEEVALPALVLPSAEVVAIGSSRLGFSRRAKAAAGSFMLRGRRGDHCAVAQSHRCEQSRLESSARAQTGEPVVVLSALATPGHKVVDLSNEAQQPIAKFVMLPDGTGYLVKSHMPVLESDQTYQLWGIVNGKPVSIGVMGNSPGSVTFTMASSPAPTELAVTVQQSGGSLKPSKNFVASGERSITTAYSVIASSDPNWPAS
jgi:anti-sigma-K factor RskA